MLLMRPFCGLGGRTGALLMIPLGPDGPPKASFFSTCALFWRLAVSQGFGGGFIVPSLTVTGVYTKTTAPT